MHTAKYHIHCNNIRILRYITSLCAGSRPSLQMMATLVRELQVLLQVARCCRMQSAGRGASAQVMITADLTCRPRGDAATAPVVISRRCHNDYDCTRGNYIALWSEIWQWDEIIRSHWAISVPFKNDIWHGLNWTLTLKLGLVELFTMDTEAVKM